MNKYAICSRCVMDTTDPEIQFDAAGVCDHCGNFESKLRAGDSRNQLGDRKLEILMNKIRVAGRGKQYDCALGLSGGVDSSYVALKAFEWGLRPLVVHVDTGWNSEAAVSNIEKIVKYCNFELQTNVVNWEEMKDLQLAYLRSGVANQDVPQDHAIFASLYCYCVRNKITTILSGGNTATEGIFPRAWHANAMDSINLRAIHRSFGNRPFKYFPVINFWKLYLLYPLIFRMRTIRILNFIPYVKEAAISELISTCGWKPYGRKHGESNFTKIFQNHFLPQRFGFDKRRPHLSSLICSGQLSRDQALVQLSEPLYDPEALEIEIAFFCNKLTIARADYETILSLPLRHHSDFPTWDKRYRRLKSVQAWIERVSGRRLNIYS